MKNNSQTIAIVVVKKAIFALAIFACIGGAHAYEFNITNSTAVKITSVEASEDGETWGKFNIGAGLAAGATTTITWDASTDESGCAWQVRASYADGSEAAPAEFDFCEEDIEIEFTE